MAEIEEQAARLEAARLRTAAVRPTPSAPEQSPSPPSGRRVLDRSRRIGVAALRTRPPAYGTPPRGTCASASQMQTDRSPSHGSAHQAADGG